MPRPQSAEGCGFAPCPFCLDGAPIADGGAKPRSGAFAPYNPVERLFINCHRLQCQDAPEEGGERHVRWHREELRKG